MLQLEGQLQEAREQVESMGAENQQLLDYIRKYETQVQELEAQLGVQK